MAQLVTSPFVFPIAFDIAGAAQRAYRISIGVDDNTHILHDLANIYHSACRVLQDTDGKYSQLDVIETQAVTQGVRWMTPDANGRELRWIANFLYEERSQNYVRLLNDVCNSFSDEIGTILLPKICYLSLQANNPVGKLNMLLNMLATEASRHDIVSYTPAQLCEWAGAPVSPVSRSLRERTPFLRNAAGEFLRLTDHPWTGLFTQYFDEFEAISDSGKRLDLLMGLQGGHTFSQFSPLFTVYPDGEVHIRGTDHSDQSAIANEARHGYVKSTLNMLLGLEFLQSHLAKHPV